MKLKLLLFVLPLLVVSAVTALSAPLTGELDRSFRPTPDHTTNLRVRAIVVQPDGKFVIAGTFLKVNDIQVNSVARFNADGSLDTTFDAAGTIFGAASVLALQPDGKILVGGSFDSVARQINRRRLARLNADGSFDATFNANLPAFAGAVTAIAVQGDGKILVNGPSAFSSKDFGRFNADGSIDTGFTLNPGFVSSIAVQADGKILLTGGPFTIDSQTRNGIARINANGTLDAAFVNQNVVGSINIVRLLPSGKMFIGGLFSTVNGVAQRRLARLNADGSHETAYTNNLDRVVNIWQIAVQSDGKVIYSGTDTAIFRENADGSTDPDFRTRTRVVGDVDAIAVLQDDRLIAGGFMDIFNSTPPSGNDLRYQALAMFAADGTLNDQFEPDVAYSDGLNTGDIVIQGDGKILFSDVPANKNRLPDPLRPHIVRYNSDSSIDTSFTFPLGTLPTSTLVTRMALQADGKIVYGTMNSSTKLIGRVNADGSVDSSFNVTFNGSGQIFYLEVQPDGRILILGTFTQINGQARAGLARLNADGSLDAFNPTFTDSQNDPAPVNSLKMQPDGKFYISGGFEKVDGSTRAKVARFNADGSLDNGFVNASTQFQFVVPVFQAVQPDGKALAAVSGGLVRFNTDGSLDSQFTIVTFRRNVNTTATPIAAGVLPNGKILIGGAFTSTNDFIPRFGFARLNADGTLDTTYGVNGGVSGGEGTVYRIAVQPDGKAYIAGRFQYVNNISQPTLARLKPSAAPFNSVADFDGDGLTDASVFRNGDWLIRPSSAPQTFNRSQFGLASDKLAPGDYDGDGKTDVAVYREGEQSAFYILQSSSNTVRIDNFGITGDVLTVGDWDGDQRADVAVYRNGAQSTFYYRGSSNNPAGNTTFLPWGVSGDVPMRGDFDGDGRFDEAVLRPGDNVWFIRQSSNGQVRYERWGLATDKFVGGDYDADGETDMAVFRDGVWYIMQSSTGTPVYRQFGLASDTLVPGDYDGDGKTDIAVWRDGLYYIQNSASSSVTYQSFGLTGDRPAAAAYIR